MTYGLTPPLPALPQGEAIDRIEDNVNAAADHVGVGTHALGIAVVHVHRNRKVCSPRPPCVCLPLAPPHPTLRTMTHFTCAYIAVLSDLPFPTISASPSPLSSTADLCHCLHHPWSCRSHTHCDCDHCGSSSVNDYQQILNCKHVPSHK